MKRPKRKDFKSEKDYLFHYGRYLDELQKRAIVKFLPIRNDLNFCGCIDQCSSKRYSGYYCRSKRNCPYKIVKNENSN